MAISVGDAVLRITGDTKDLDRSMSGLKDRVKKSMAGISKQLKVVGVAFTAVGAASLKLAGDSRKLNAQLSQVAIGLGLTTEEVRDLTLETTNVTFPLKSVANTFELLTRAGIKDQQMLMDAATAFDTLGDATGASGEDMARLLLPAFKLFGEALPTTAKELDRFTFLTKTTTVDLQDFGTMLTRMAPEMDTLNLSMDDAVLLLAALSEKGIEGSAATLALRTAITKAAREGKTLNEVMGITPEVIARLTAEMEGATGITQEYADAANTQFGVMDKLKHKWSELSLRAGSFLEPMEPILAGITVLGPLMILLSTSVGANAVAWVANAVALIASKVAMAASVAITTALTVAQWLLNAAMTANPIALVIIAIGALIAAGVLLWKNWDIVKAKVLDAWAAIKTAIRTAIDWVKNHLEIIMPIIGGILLGPFGALAVWLVTHRDDVVEFFTNMKDNLVEILNDIKNAIIHPFNLAKDGMISAMEAVLTFFSELPGKFLGYANTIKDWIIGSFEEARTGMVNAFKGGINTIIGFINRLISKWNALSFTIPRLSISIPKKTFGSITIFPGLDIGAGPWTFGFPSMPTIPRLAEGGIITKPTLAMIGENGPEAVVPLDKGMGTTFVWNQFGPIWNDQDMEDKVGRFVKHIADRGGLAGVFN